jgi:hypothetical protein
MHQHGVQDMSWSHMATSFICSFLTHDLATHNSYLNYDFRFGGTDGQYHYNDTWCFDTSTGTWSDLTCIGFIPLPREGHAAALVDDVMYVFGGRGVDGKDLGDLAAFKISSMVIFRNPYALSNLISNRSKVVYVPKHGSCTFWSLRSCNGLFWDPGICIGRRVFHRLES